MTIEIDQIITDVEPDTSAQTSTGGLDPRQREAARERLIEAVVERVLDRLRDLWND